MYYMWIDIALILATLSTFTAIVLLYVPPTKGATYGNVKRHQRRRRAYMLKRGAYALRCNHTRTTK